MKVVDNRATEEKRVYFNELSLGTVYSDSHGNICIKIDDTEFEPNCLYFCEGKWKQENEDADEPVTVLNAKLIIEN